MKKKKSVVAVLTGVFLMSGLLSACIPEMPQVSIGSSEHSSFDYSANPYGSWFPFGEELKTEGVADHLVDAEPQLDPQEVYDRIEYNPILFYGQHANYYMTSNDIDFLRAGDDFYTDMEWSNPTEFLGYENLIYYDDKYEISEIPFSFGAGANDINYQLSKIQDYYWCELMYAIKNTETGEYDYLRVDAAYELKGDELIVKPISEISGDEEAGIVTYAFSGAEIHYQFQFAGPILTISKDGCKTELLETSFYSQTPGANYLSMEGAQPAFDNPIPDINTITVIYKEDAPETSHMYLEYGPNGEGETFLPLTDIAIKLHENGIVQFGFVDKNGVAHSYEYVFFPLGGNGMAFSDGVNTYMYLDSYTSYMDEKYEDTYGINVSPEDQEKLATLEVEELELLEEKKESLLTDFSTALTELGVNATVDEKTGEIVFDASILFDKNEADISEEGKEALANFSKVFTEILGKEEYQGFLSQVVIQGHTDSDGEYDYNKTLSLQRADAVKNCILENLAEDDLATALFEELFLTEGCASDYLIYDENGQENKDASRRVGFVFYIDLDYLDK